MQIFEFVQRWFFASAVLLKDLPGHIYEWATLVFGWSLSFCTPFALTRTVLLLAATAFVGRLCSVLMTLSLHFLCVQAYSGLYVFSLQSVPGPSVERFQYFGIEPKAAGKVKQQHTYDSIFTVTYRFSLMQYLRNLQGFPRRLGNVCRVFQTCVFVHRGKFLRLPCSLRLPLGPSLWGQCLQHLQLLVWRRGVFNRLKQLRICPNASS